MFSLNKHKCSYLIQLICLDLNRENSILWITYIGLWPGQNLYHFSFYVERMSVTQNPPKTNGQIQKYTK